MNRWKAIARGLIDGSEARKQGLKARDNPDRKSAYGKGWKKGWRRLDREIKEKDKKLKNGYVIEGTDIFYRPATVSKKNESTTNFRSDLTKIYKAK